MGGVGGHPGGRPRVSQTGRGCLPTSARLAIGEIILQFNFFEGYLDLPFLSHSHCPFRIQFGMMKRKQTVAFS